MEMFGLRVQQRNQLQFQHPEPIQLLLQAVVVHLLHLPEQRLVLPHYLLRLQLLQVVQQLSVQAEV